MNGIVEQCIGYISTWTLTMLLHAQAQWPQVINKQVVLALCYMTCHQIICQLAATTVDTEQQ